MYLIFDENNTKEDTTEICPRNLHYVLDEQIDLNFQGLG